MQKQLRSPFQISKESRIRYYIHFLMSVLLLILAWLSPSINSPCPKLLTRIHTAASATGPNLLWLFKHYCNTMRSSNGTLNRSRIWRGKDFKENNTDR